MNRIMTCRKFYIYIIIKFQFIHIDMFIYLLCLMLGTPCIIASKHVSKSKFFILRLKYIDEQYCSISQNNITVQIFNVWSIISSYIAFDAITAAVILFTDVLELSFVHAFSIFYFYLFFYSFIFSFGRCIQCGILVIFTNMQINFQCNCY